MHRTFVRRLGRSQCRQALPGASPPVTSTSTRSTARVIHQPRSQTPWTSTLSLTPATPARLPFKASSTRHLSTSAPLQPPSNDGSKDDVSSQGGTYSEADHEHAVISTFDLFSIGIGPSSSHTVGPMRAGNIFVTDLVDAGLLARVAKIKVALYGSLALTGEGHMTPSALLLGLESADVETVDTDYVPKRFEQIKAEKTLFLGKGLPEGRGRGKEIAFDYDRDMIWRWGEKLPLHSNGMRLSVFDEEGVILATNDLFSVGGGFVVNGSMSISSSPTRDAAADSSAAPMTAQMDGSEADRSIGHPADLQENLFYKEIRRADAAGDRKTGAEIKPTEHDQLLLAADERDLTTASRDVPVTGVEGDTDGGRSTTSQQPSYPFRDARSLVALCNKHNLTIAQLVYENEKSHGYTDEQILEKLFRIWEVMDNSILEGVQAPANAHLPGSLRLHRRAPALYKRLTRGLYASHTQVAAGNPQAQLASPPSETRNLPGDNPVDTQPTSLAPSAPGRAPLPPTPTKTTSSRITALHNRNGLQRIHGSLQHPIMPSPQRRTAFPAMDYLTVYAIAVNETNAAGGRIVTAPTNGAAGIIPAVLKYTTEFISDDPDRDIATFLLTAAAIGMLYKRGATISAAEGGCMAEVGVACSMAAGAFAACMGGSPETIEQAAEIGIEHNLGLTCDPIGGLVQAPCIERNALGAVKAVSSANLALQSSPGAVKVRLDDAIRAMRLTAQGMRNEFKETSLSGLATSVPLNIPVSVPDC